MKSKLWIAVAGIALATAPQVSHAQGLEIWNRNCMRLYNKWKRQPRHKAFAVATSARMQACGAAWKARSVKAAKQTALKACRSAAEDNAPCRITKAE